MSSRVCVTALSRSLRSWIFSFNDATRTSTTRASYAAARQLHTTTPRYAARSKKLQEDKEKRAKQSAKADARLQEAIERQDQQKHASSLVPGSQQVLSGDDLAEYEKADEKMGGAVDWFRKQLSAAETRGSGRVMPDMLNGVMVQMPGSTQPVSLTHVATVGVREGTTLIITVFEEDNLKHVEKALYAAKLPHVVPQKIDKLTIKAPIPRATVEERSQLYTNASKQAEEVRVQIRHQEQQSVKKRKYTKRSAQLQEFEDLRTKHINAVDNLLAGLKKTFGIK